MKCAWQQLMPELLVWENLLLWDSQDTYGATVSKEVFPWVPVSNLALSAVGRLLMLCKSTLTVTNTLFAGWAWGLIKSTVMDSNIIVSNWSLGSLLSPSLCFPLANLRWLCRSLLLGIMTWLFFVPLPTTCSTLATGTANPCPVIFFLTI